MQLAGRQQFFHHRRHAAGAVEFLAEEAAGGLQVDQQGDFRTEALPVVKAVLDAHMPGDGDHVDRAVG